MASFPGAEAPNLEDGGKASVNKNVSGSWEMSNDVEALAQGTSIFQEIQSLRKEAAGFAKDTEQYIEDCKNFEAAVEPITFFSPPFLRANLNVFDPGDINLIIPEIPDDSLVIIPPTFIVGTIPEYNAAPDAAPPEAAFVEIPPDTGVIRDFSPPTPIASAELTVPEPPDFEPYTPGETPFPVPPVLSPGSSVFPELPELKELELPEIDDDELKRGIDKLRAVVEQRPTVPSYTSVTPELFSIVGSLIAGAPKFVSDTLKLAKDRALLFAQRQTDVLTKFLTRRGIDDLVNVSLFLERETEREKLEREIYEAVTIGMANDDTARMAFKIGAAAYSELISIRGMLLDAEFEALATEAEAQMSLWEATAMAYQGLVTSFAGKVKVHSADYSKEEMNVAKYSAEITEMKAKASRNIAVANIFAGRQQIHSITVDVDSTRLDTEKAKLVSYKSEIEAVVAKAQALGARAEIFKGEIAQWNAEVTRVVSEWRNIQSRARGIVAINRGKEQQAQLSSAKNTQIAAQASIIASLTAATAAQLKAEIAQRVGINMAGDAQNQLIQTQVQVAEQLYSAEVQTEILDASVKNVGLDAAAAEASAATRFFTQASEAIYRAANMTQSANIELASAYAAARESAGKAGAAIESGRFGGFTAHASMSASGTLGAADGWSRQVANSYTTQIQEVDSTQQSLNQD